MEKHAASPLQRIGLVAGPLLALLLLFIPLKEGAPELSRMAAVAALMAVYWLTEAIPIPVTALLPVALFPLMGIMSGEAAAGEYINKYIFLFMGGFMVAIGLKRWALHRRMALAIIAVMGQEPKRLIFGFMVATAFLSMWISNTASTMMMLPIALSIITLVRDRDPDGPLAKRFPLALLLGIAYAASIGGIGTLIGTPPNVALVQIYEIEFPGAPKISFMSWMLMAAPFVALFLVISWATLVYVVYPLKGGAPAGGEQLKEERAALGSMTSAEIRLAVVFGLMALGWMLRKRIEIGGLSLPGWPELLQDGLRAVGFDPPKLTQLIDDGTVAMLAALSLFFIPSKGRGSAPLMSWEDAKEIPWGILLLFGGGFALAKGFNVTGLSEWIGQQLSFLGGFSQPVLVTGIAGSITFLTELTSNTATTQMILPILAGVARELGVNPLLLMIPATLAASCAFMLPVATPPNAIVFGSNEIPIKEMIRAGIILNLVGVVLIVILVFTLGAVVFGLSG